MAFMQLDFYSESLAHNTTVYIILPQGFSDQDSLENGTYKYKTLYLLHGYMGNHTDWIRFSAIERYSSENRLAVIMFDANNSYYTNMEYGPNYFDFYTKELPTYLESILPLSTKRENRFIIGLSMGGYGAIKAALTYPNKYQFAASLSGALDLDFIVKRPNDERRIKQLTATFGKSLNISNTENDLFFLANNIKNTDSLPTIYINCGTEDFLFDSNKKFVSHLNSLNINSLSEYYPGNHNWEYWDKHIVTALNKIFK
ncbi:MAG: alpha/beta hydrolase family protein [Acholeplasma sp.]|nr:alpha/beta hydrolase family protein [Acholeplasma sp.]